MVSHEAMHLAGALFQAIGASPCPCGRMERILSASQACVARAHPDDQRFLEVFLDYFAGLHAHGWSFEAAQSLAPLLREYRGLVETVADLGGHPETARYWADKIAQGAGGASYTREPAPKRIAEIPAPAIHYLSALYSFPETSRCLPCEQARFSEILQQSLACLQNAPLPTRVMDCIRAFVHFYQRMLAREYYWSYAVMVYESRMQPTLSVWRGLMVDVASTEAAPQSAPYWATELANLYKERRYVAIDSREFAD